MSELNVVDSSGWLEYFADTKNAGNFAAPIQDTKNLIVPVISIYEVFKKVLRERGEDIALHVVGAMRSARVVEISLSLSLEAARYQLPMADSIIYATAQRFNATLWTQDEHFADLPNVQYFRK